MTLPEAQLLFIPAPIVLVLIPWTLITLYRLCKVAEDRKLRLLKLAIWWSVVSVIIVLERHKVEEKRLQAEQMIGAIIDYRQQHQAYPTDLKTVGITEIEFKDKLGRGQYYLKDGKPVFYYMSAFFTAKSFNFSTNQWETWD